MKIKYFRTVNWVFVGLAACWLGLLAGCAKYQDEPPQAIQGGVYLFALNKDKTPGSSNAVREAINRTLTPDFALPSKFVFLDHKGKTIALISMPYLPLDNAQSRELKLGQSAPKLKA